MSEATHIGRFIYIDPNNMNADSISNGIPQPYEDYCISVNLEVKIPSRFACGTECINDDSSSKTIYFSSDNGTISFFGGSGAGKDENGEYQQGFLTTNYTDISSSDMAHGNKETLGIESINISYDSWMYPIITIKFIDLRGSALFMPQEQAYYNAISYDSKDITQMSSGSFFKALFSFPQPLFKLTVKGFYGRPVVYNLAWLPVLSHPPVRLPDRLVEKRIQNSLFQRRLHTIIYGRVQSGNLILEKMPGYRQCRPVLA